MSVNKMWRQKNTESGSALVYILIAIALLAALTASFMKPSSQQTTSQNTFNTVTELNSQANFIRSAIQECVITYPAGEGGLVGIQVNPPYPINPSSDYFTAPGVGAGAPAANDQVRNLRCPGNPGDSDDHSDIFAGTSGKFMPPAPNLFEEWIYYEGDDGVFFFTRTDKSDAFLQTALTKLDDQFSECEADVVDTSFAPAGDKDMTSTAAELVCPDGSTCFRLWMIANGSAFYDGDRGGDEGGC